MRVALVAGMAPPYRIPVWEKVHERMGSLTVFLCALTEANRVWKLDDGWRRGGPDYQVVPGFHAYVQRRDWGVHLNPGLLRALSASRPEAMVVMGYDTPSYLLAMQYAKRAGIPLVLWSGSHALSSRSKRGIIAALRRRVVHWADSYVTYGTWATEYLVSMGVRREQISTARNTVDVQRLHALVRQTRQAQAITRKTPVRFLYVGQFIERKGVRQLLDAFGALHPSKATLALLGHGPLGEELRRIVTERRMENVKFLGKATKMDELAVHYANADVLVMPSLFEVWGLVVNEALASGLYVLSSKYAGVTPDLVSSAPEKVGDEIDPLDQESLLQYLREATARVRAGVDREAITRWGLQHTPEAYADAVCEAIALARDRHGLVDSKASAGSESL